MTSKTNTTTRVLLKNARLAFPQLFEPRIDPDSGRKSYGAAFIIPPDHPQIEEIHNAMDAAGKAKWADKWPAQKKVLEKQDRLALHDGDIKAKYAGYEGNLYINANSSEDSPPTVVDRARNLIGRNSGVIYPGCYVNVSLEFWAQKDHPKGGSRVNAQLRGVQFFKDGEAFSAGRPANTEEFEDMSDGSDGIDAGDFA